jgi:hypothetical protein
MPQVAWSRSVEGCRPGLFLTAARALLHYAAPEQERPNRLACFDLDGKELWRREGLRGLLSLPGGRFLVNTPEGSPLVLDADGRVMHRWAGAGVAEVTDHAGLLVFADTPRAWGVGPDLTPLWELDWPGPGAPRIDCFAEGAFYWAEENELRFCHRAGRHGTFCEVPEFFVAAAAERFERSTERRAFPEGGFPFRWRVRFDARRWVFLLANFIPHLVLCIDALKRPRWCECLSEGCCGGLPYPLPAGGYVASSGCGGVLTWLAWDGEVLGQSEPHEGVGLATAYDNRVVVLPDGRALVHGGPGIVAYGPDGRRLWVFAADYYDLHCDPAGDFLVGCYWERDEAGGASRACLGLINGL